MSQEIFDAGIVKKLRNFDTGASKNFLLKNVYSYDFISHKNMYD